MSTPASHLPAAASDHAAPHASVAVLAANFVALMLLLAATVALAEVDLGRGNFIASTAIAATKALLIMLIFMNLGYGAPLPRLVACAGLFWLAIMFGLTFADYLSRDWLTLSGG